MDARNEELKGCFPNGTGARIVSIRSALPGIRTKFEKERFHCQRGRCELGQLALRGSIGCLILKTRPRRRTKKFAGRIVRLYVTLPLNQSEVFVLGKQMLRSGTAVAANCPACEIKNDPRLICDMALPEISALWKEADELIAIFVTMSKNTKLNKNKPETLRPET